MLYDTEGVRMKVNRYKMFDTNSHSCGRPSLRPGTPGGSEELTQAYWKYVEESDAATTKVYT